MAGEAQRRVEAVVVEVVASVESRPAGSGDLAFCGFFGCRTVGELLQRVLRVDAMGATRVVKTARAVRREVDLTSGGWLPARWPALRASLLHGTVGVDGVLAATGPIERAGARVGTADRLRADAELAAYARGLPAAEQRADDQGGAESGVDDGTAPPATPEDLRVLAQVIVQYLDPDGAEPADEIAMRARGIVIGRAKDGVIPIRGGLLPEVAGQLRRLFDAYLNPKVDGPPQPGVAFRPSDTARTSSPEVEGADDGFLPSEDPVRTIDPRTRAQKQHDTLSAVLSIAARHDDTPRLGGAAPTLVVTVTAEDYATGSGWARIEGIDTPCPPESPRTPRAGAACSGSCSTRLGASSESIPPTASSTPINVGRSLSATVNASSPAVMCPRPGARSITWTSTPAAERLIPTTASRCAGTTTEPSPPVDGRSGCDRAPPPSAALPGGIRAGDGELRARPALLVPARRFDAGICCGRETRWNRSGVSTGVTRCGMLAGTAPGTASGVRRDEERRPRNPYVQTTRGTAGPAPHAQRPRDPRSSRAQRSADPFGPDVDHRTLADGGDPGAADA